MDIKYRALIKHSPRADRPDNDIRAHTCHSMLAPDRSMSRRMACHNRPKWMAPGTIVHNYSHCATLDRRHWRGCTRVRTHLKYRTRVCVQSFGIDPLQQNDMLTSLTSIHLNTRVIKWIGMEHFVAWGKSGSLQYRTLIMSLGPCSWMLAIVLGVVNNSNIQIKLQHTGGTMHWGLTRWG